MNHTSPGRGGHRSPRRGMRRARARTASTVVAIFGVLATVAACTTAPVGGGANTPGIPAAGATSSAVSAGPVTSAGSVTSGPGTVTAPGPPSSAVAPSTSPPTDQSSGPPPADPATSSAPTSTAEPEPAATVTATPKFGSTGLSVLSPITVTVSNGTITAFALTNPDGKEVAGTLSADSRTWTSGVVLGYGKTYTATGSALGADGARVPIAGTFATLAPKSKVNARINIGDGAVVGVAAPIVVTFGGVKPKDRALIEKHISVTTEPKVLGAWGWINHDGGILGLDFRTKDFWPAGTKVHVSVNTYGLDFGDGRYGAADVTSDFTIGRNQVVYADVNSHDMIVKRNGKVTEIYPASYGRGTDEATTTRSGIHVINEFFELKLMSNPRYGYTNYPAKWAVRISNNGEFIHANQSTVGAQGSTNVSHGCVNLSLANAEKFYKSALYGDPVIITGTDVKLSASDGDIFDWALSWSQWQALSALG